jgi:hypothetical protein
MIQTKPPVMRSGRRRASGNARLPCIARTELRKGEEAFRRNTRDAVAAHARADRALAEAHRLDCAAWSALQFIGGDEAPSPVIADAIHGGCELLEVQCRRCNHTDLVDLTLATWPRQQPGTYIASSAYCKHCMTEHNKKHRPDLVGLRTREQPDPSAPAQRHSAK